MRVLATPPPGALTAVWAGVVASRDTASARRSSPAALGKPSPTPGPECLLFLPRRQSFPRCSRGCHCSPLSRPLVAPWPPLCRSCLCPVCEHSTCPVCLHVCCLSPALVCELLEARGALATGVAGRWSRARVWLMVALAAGSRPPGCCGFRLLGLPSGLGPSVSPPCCSIVMCGCLALRRLF